MAGALNKQGRLLYFYGLGGGSGDGARVFGGGARHQHEVPGGKKGSLFPVETEIPTRHCVGLQ